jgi:hypothetical protein
MKIETKIPELGYWDTAFDEVVLLKDILPYLKEDSLNKLGIINLFLLETEIIFENMFQISKEEKNKKHSVTYTPEGIRENEKNSIYPFRIEFSKRSFSLGNFFFLGKWKEAEFRKNTMLELKMNKKDELKNNFSPKNRNGLTEYEEKLLNEAKTYIEKKSEEIKNQTELIDEIAITFEKICIERTNKKQDITNLKMKEFKVN